MITIAEIRARRAGIAPVAVVPRSNETKNALEVADFGAVRTAKAAGLNSCRTADGRTEITNLRRFTWNDFLKRWMCNDRPFRAKNGKTDRKYVMTDMVEFISGHLSLLSKKREDVGNVSYQTPIIKHLRKIHCLGNAKDYLHDFDFKAIHRAAKGLQTVKSLDADIRYKQIVGLLEEFGALEKRVEQVEQKVSAHGKEQQKQSEALHELYINQEEQGDRIDALEDNQAALEETQEEHGEEIERVILENRNQDEKLADHDAKLADHNAKLAELMDFKRMMEQNGGAVAFDPRSVAADDDDYYDDDGGGDDVLPFDDDVPVHGGGVEETSAAAADINSGAADGDAGVPVHEGGDGKNIAVAADMESGAADRDDDVPAPKGGDGKNIAVAGDDKKTTAVAGDNKKTAAVADGKTAVISSGGSEAGNKKKPSSSETSFARGGIGSGTENNSSIIISSINLAANVLEASKKSPPLDTSSANQKKTLVGVESGAGAEPEVANGHTAPEPRGSYDSTVNVKTSGPALIPPKPRVQPRVQHVGIGSAQADCFPKKQHTNFAIGAAGTVSGPSKKVISSLGIGTENLPPAAFHQLHPEQSAHGNGGGAPSKPAPVAAAAAAAEDVVDTSSHCGSTVNSWRAPTDVLASRRIFKVRRSNRGGIAPAAAANEKNPFADIKLTAAVGSGGEGGGLGSTSANEPTFMPSGATAFSASTAATNKHPFAAARLSSTAVSSGGGGGISGASTAGRVFMQKASAFGVDTVGTSTSYITRSSSTPSPKDIIHNSRKNRLKDKSVTAFPTDAKFATRPEQTTPKQTTQVGNAGDEMIPMEIDTPVKSDVDLGNDSQSSKPAEPDQVQLADNPSRTALNMGKKAPEVVDPLDREDHTDQDEQQPQVDQAANQDMYSDEFSFLGPEPPIEQQPQLSLLGRIRNRVGLATHPDDSFDEFTDEFPDYYYYYEDQFQDQERPEEHQKQPSLLSRAGNKLRNYVWGGEPEEEDDDEFDFQPH